TRGRGLRRRRERADAPADVLEIAGPTVALGTMRAHPGALLGRQRALEIVRDQLDELLADERIVLVPAPPPPHQPVTSTSGDSSVRTRVRARCSSTRWLPSLISSRSQTSAAEHPTRSRSVITARCSGPSVSPASSIS